MWLKTRLPKSGIPVEVTFAWNIERSDEPETIEISSVMFQGYDIWLDLSEFTQDYIEQQAWAYVKGLADLL